MSISFQLIDLQHQVLLFKMSYTVETFVFYLSGEFKLVQLYMVYHHATLPILAWVAMNFWPTGHSVFFIFVNMFIHSIMFSYLFLMLWIPKLKKLNWQAFISWLNIIQITAIFIHGGQLFFRNPCNYPMTIVWISATWGVSIVVVFVMTWPFLTKKRVKALEEAGDSVNIEENRNQKNVTYFENILRHRASIKTDVKHMDFM